ncbi:glycosyltransferase family 2 protein [Helcococcus ovis]|uniref:glycosyltransferase family 2 protein n=1 Tax=Helcococcus ovis TaxID=72026 RepID=UPI00106F2BEF|nr:glycosyltransferase family 2 protein [Helcococcus ovis]TFF68888.1 glycosyltransferase [Helcococcus ovis]WNZ00681.1 glycosyltransferase family 2 protein [Helcococcus ovis]
MILKIITYIVIFLSLILIPYSLYQFFIGLHYFKKINNIPDTDNYNKFAILVAARNEAKVISNLIDSLKSLNYPKDKYEIIIAPNNCTDNTREVAINKQVRVFDIKSPIKNKGDVLHQMFDYLIDNEDHDAYVIFDADNIVDKNFLLEMNKQIEYGFSASQGFRDSKNPYESFTSGSYTLYHYMISTFYNKPRTALKLNNMIIGCGFMVTKKVIKSLGGWNTKTITEDLEFTVLTTLQGEKIGYTEKAIFYDEQPNSFIDSWHQRIRWQLGLKQGFLANSREVLKSLFRGKGVNFLDTYAMLIANYISNISLLSMIFGTILISMKTTSIVGFSILGYNIIGMVFGPSLFAILILALNGKKIIPMWKGILFFGVFLASWIPINAYVLFKDNVEWKEIKHDSKNNITN